MFFLYNTTNKRMINKTTSTYKVVGFRGIV